MAVKNRILKLGTRKSLLARAQSAWVARELERLNPTIQVQLVGIETQGDRIQDIPLSKIEGKEFFVAEIDQALISGEVDLTVHSLKDLSLERPESLSCAAIPRRENPRDVVLFGPHVLERLKAGVPLKIGTSSPRRLENLPQFLKNALPKLDRSTKQGSLCEFVEIRGNVNTRLSRVQEPLDSDRYLDGVVLAFAGLIRLWADAEGRAELSQLLNGVRWMVMPLREAPAAPAQGALSVECRTVDQETLGAIGKLHHQATAENIAAERALLKKWGGGCHQRFGATALNTESLGTLLFVRGESTTGARLDEIHWNIPNLIAGAPVIPWDGSQRRKEAETESGQDGSLGSVYKAGASLTALFVAHSRAVEKLQLEPLLEKSRIWTSGVSSWYKLASLGHWVEGCAEGFGFDFLQPTLNEGVLRLPQAEDWTVLTHESALQEWEDRNISAIGTYRVNSVYGNDAKKALQAATHVFWSSGSQFNELKGWAIPSVAHACGPGKTGDRLRQAGIDPVVFPSAEEWRKWLQVHQKDSILK